MVSTLRKLLQSRRVCKWAVVLCAALWGSSFVVMKDVTEAFSVSWVLAIRFLPTGLVFLFLLRHRVAANMDRRTALIGILYGVLNWAAYFVQTIGLTMTTPGKNAFLTATYCVMVPFCAWLMGAKRPKANHVLGVILSMAGLALVALDNGLPFNEGDLWTLLSAAFYALAIALLSVRGAGIDALVISAWEFVVMGALSLVSALLIDGPLDVSLLTVGNVARLAYLLVMCTAVALTLFNHALTIVNPTQASLLSALESPFGVATSVLLGVELLTGRLLAGFALIASGIVSSEAGQIIVRRTLGRPDGEEPSPVR